MSETTRTGPLIGKLVEGIQADIGEAVEQLQAGLSKIRALEAHTKGVNGLSSTLKAEASKLDQMISTLTDESEAVGRKMLGTGREPITEKVDAAHLEKVTAARSMA